MTDTATQVDVLIVGGGINGAGVFRDLCEQGLTCAIVDKGDFGSGTSAAPSRLIHGGLKYLETGEFRLVAESTYERNLLLANAPHLVKPLPTLIPILSWTEGVWAALRTLCGSTTAPRGRGAVLIKIGLSIYDHFGKRARRMPRHAMLSRSRARAQIPALTPRIKAVGAYYDAAVTGPERLVLELVQDGLSASPASQALNWSGVVGQRSGIVSIARPDGTTMLLRPRHVVNAAGPWIDRVNASLGTETALIGGTKGSHILLDHPELMAQLDGRMIYFEGSDGRILLVFPYLGRALVGSTDIPADDPDRIFCTEDETAYFMQALRGLLPGLAFHNNQIVFAYTGLRPLPNSAGVAPGLISRDHSMPVLDATDARPFPVVSLVGGKWTTFRAFSAQVADLVLADLGRARRRATDDLAIGGGRDWPDGETARDVWVARVARQTGGQSARLRVLLDRYGTTAEHVAMHEGATPDPLPDAPDFTAQEIDWIALNERVEHLQDILLRRTPLAITGRLTPPLCDRICATAGVALGWDKARMASEMDQTRAVLRDRHGVQI